MRLVTLAFILLLLFVVPNSLIANDYYVNGYKVNLKWHHKTDLENQDMFVVSGSVSEGKSCKKLELLVAFGNHNYYKGYVPVAQVFIEDYDYEVWNDFRGQVHFKTDKKHLSTWGFKKLEVLCLE